MGLEQFTNNAQTTLNGGISTTNPITLVVTSASLFPTTGNFRIRIDDELLLVTAVSGTSFTCDRGIEGTSNVSHSSGATVSLVLTSASFEQFLSDRGILPIAISDRKPATPGTYDEEFEGTADTLPTNWSWDTTPSGSDEYKINTRWPSLLTLEGTGNAGYNLTRASFTPGSGNFGIWWKIYFGSMTAADVKNVRISCRDSTGTADARTWEIYASGRMAPNTRSLKIVSSGGEAVWDSAILLSPDATHMYGGLTRTSGNIWTSWWSRNGLSWQGGSQETHSFTVNKLNFFVGTSAIQTLFGIDWVRSRADLLFPRF